MSQSFILDARVNDEKNISEMNHKSTMLKSLMKMWRESHFCDWSYYNVISNIKWMSPKKIKNQMNVTK